MLIKTLRSIVVHLTILFTSLLLAVGNNAAHGEAPVPMDRGAAGLQQALARLQTTGGVLHVVAHPDDEDGPMLAYMARKEAARTMLFSITRGEGGANLISSDFFDALGILRTLEHQQAARWYGNELFYSHAVDYGYSKTLDEAERQWDDGTPILADLVRVIRRERPDVIVSRFRGDRRDGHGHHQMAGVISRQAFSAAADPNAFPEQIRAGLRPWQPRKLYIGNINPRWRSEDKDYANIVLQTDEYHPLLGRSYAQIARYGLGYQRSQGISGHESPAGPRETRYRLAATADAPASDETPKSENSFFDGLDVSISSLAQYSDDPKLVDSLRNIKSFAVQANQQFNVQDVEACIPMLLKGHHHTTSLRGWLLLSELPDKGFEIDHRLARLQRHFEDALTHALALDVTAIATLPDVIADGTSSGSSASGFNHAIAGQSLSVQVRLVNRGRSEVVPYDVVVDAPAGWQVDRPRFSHDPLNTLQVLSVAVPVQIASDAAPTQPYWHRESITEPFYEITSTEHQSLPLPPPPLQTRVTVHVDNVPIQLTRPVQIVRRHPEFGRVEYPLTVVPKLNIRFANDFGMVPIANQTHIVRVHVSSAAKGPCKGELKLELPPDWESQPEVAAFEFNKEDEEGVFEFQLQLSSDIPADKEFSIAAVATSDDQIFREGYRTITARDLGRFNLYKVARQIVRTVDLVVPGNVKLGYIMGSGDDVPQVLTSLGLPPTMLGEKDLASGDLNQFDTILVGVRAYAIREDLRTHNQRLLDYVHGGGNLVVQYQTPEFDHNFGPYPYRMGRSPEEISEEDAAVTILVPQHRLFQSPNRITPADFAGWVEQRGSKFWSEWDDRYTPLLECHDTGQSPQQGGMLVAQYGKGKYIYSAYAWYRQLPHGVSGAYRIFANMITPRDDVE